MWRRLAKADFLIYLHASYETCTARKSLSWTVDDYEEQLHRLRHARQYCDAYLTTEGTAPETVLEQALAALGLRPHRSTEV
jgi:hypothetical protein